MNVNRKGVWSVHNKHGVKDLFLQKGGYLNQVRGPHKFQSVSNLENVYIIQPVLHNTKGGFFVSLGARFRLSRNMSCCTLWPMWQEGTT